MSDTDFKTIREMCDDFSVTPRTLRFYEAKELLFPVLEGQKRLFTRRDRARLKLILRGKRFGFSLEEIRQLLDLYDRGDRQLTQLTKTYEIAQERLDDMERQRAEQIEAAADELARRLEESRRLEASLEDTLLVILRRLDAAVAVDLPFLPAERAERLASVLERIDETRAEAVRLRYLEGLSVADAAERMGCSETALKSRVARGLADLADRL